MDERTPTSFAALSLQEVGAWLRASHSIVTVSTIFSLAALSCKMHPTGSCFADNVRLALRIALPILFVLIPALAAVVLYQTQTATTTGDLIDRGDDFCLSHLLDLRLVFSLCCRLFTRPFLGIYPLFGLLGGLSFDTPGGLQLLAISLLLIDVGFRGKLFPSLIPPVLDLCGICPHQYFELHSLHLYHLVSRAAEGAVC